MSKLTFEQLKSICPTGKKSILEDVVTSFNEYAEEFGLNTPLRKAHFIAQVAHESAHFQTTVEYGAKNTRYFPWHGRSIMQLTWEENYKKFYQWCKKRGLDAPNFGTAKHRDKVADFPWAFLAAVFYWEWKNLNAYADKDDIRGSTKLINGGYNGLQDRINYLNKAKKVFGVGSQPEASYSPKSIQLALIAKGYNLGPSGADGIIGARTKSAIRMFQIKVGLPATGKIDSKTYSELLK